MTAFKSRAEVERMVEACVMPGVTELAPVPGFTDHAFAVHPPIPGLVFGFAIAHHDRDQDHIVLDIVRDEYQRRGEREADAALWHKHGRRRAG